MATFTENKLTHIVNPVLLELGHKRISTLNAASSDKIESLCALTIDSIITSILKLEPWVSVSKRYSSLTANSGISDEFAYLYDLPSDFVRMIGEPLYLGSPKHYASPPYVDWRIVGSVFECAFPNPDILYVYRPDESDGTDTNEYFSSIMGEEVREAIMGMCRYRWAYAITGSDKLRERLVQEFKVVTMRDSRAANLILMKRMKANQSDALRFIRLLGV